MESFSNHQRQAVTSASGTSLHLHNHYTVLQWAVLFFVVGVRPVSCIPHSPYKFYLSYHKHRISTSLSYPPFCPLKHYVAWSLDFRTVYALPCNSFSYEYQVAWFPSSKTQVMTRRICNPPISLINHHCVIFPSLLLVWRQYWSLYDVSASDGRLA